MKTKKISKLIAVAGIICMAFLQCAIAGYADQPVVHSTKYTQPPVPVTPATVLKPNTVPAPVVHPPTTTEFLRGPKPVPAPAPATRPILKGRAA
jgi:hypothetical protein